MSLGLDATPSGPGQCQKHIIMSGFQLSNTSNMQILRVPVNPHPPVVSPSALRGVSNLQQTSASNVTVLCNLGGEFAGQNSGLNYAPGGYDHTHGKLVVSATRVLDSRNCWLSVDVASCRATCISQIQYLDSQGNLDVSMGLQSSDDGPRDRAFLDTIAFSEPDGMFVGIGRYLFANGTVGVVPGVLNAQSASMTIPLSVAPQFQTWDSSWEGTIAVDSEADRMYWLGYTNEAMGNELVHTSASAVVAAANAKKATAAPAVPSTSIGKLCGTHTDDMVAVGCPFAISIGRDSYWGQDYA